MTKRQAKKMSVLLNKKNNTNTVNKATEPKIVLGTHYVGDDIGRKSFDEMRKEFMALYPEYQIEDVAVLDDTGEYQRLCEAFGVQRVYTSKNQVPGETIMQNLNAIMSAYEGEN